ncbi:MAG: hypothetical protein R2706_00670 [Acidimicrobiales bacterium]
MTVRRFTYLLALCLTTARVLVIYRRRGVAAHDQRRHVDASQCADDTDVHNSRRHRVEYRLRPST